jgi:acetyl esterase/lipase
VSAEVKSAVLVYGIYDVFKQWQADLALNPGVEGNVTRNLIGKDPYEDPQRFFDASPTKYVTYARNRLPVLVSWGSNDEFVNPADQSEQFVRVLQQARFNVRTHRAVGASHFWFAQPPEEAGTDSAHLAPRLLMFPEVDSLAAHGHPNSPSAGAAFLAGRCTAGLSRRPDRRSSGRPRGECGRSGRFPRGNRSRP